MAGRQAYDSEWLLFIPPRAVNESQKGLPEGRRAARTQFQPYDVLSAVVYRFFQGSARECQGSAREGRCAARTQFQPYDLLLNAFDTVFAMQQRRIIRLEFQPYDSLFAVSYSFYHAGGQNRKVGMF